MVHTPGPRDENTLAYYQCGCRIQRGGEGAPRWYFVRCDLHAAAPEMLVGLVRAEQTIRNLATCGALDGDYKQIALNEADNLRDDIAKARGGLERRHTTTNISATSLVAIVSTLKHRWQPDNRKG